MARSRQTTAAAAGNGTANGAADLGEPEQAKKHKPIDTRLRQQRLPAWQPIYNAKTVIPVFFTISILFIPIGIVLLITSNGVKEWSIYYDTACEGQISAGNRNCVINFQLEEDFKGNVYFYYGLENFYQNHRRYMRSRNDLQLLGDLSQVSECAPFDSLNGVPIAPCGAIANSMFNDTFSLVDANNNNIDLTYEELIWPADRAKFRNPRCQNGQECRTTEDLCQAFDQHSAKPPNWPRSPCQLDAAVVNSGFQNADFIIWMRTAAFPDFRKPYRKLNAQRYPNGLAKGGYQLRVVYNYNVSSFSGRKSFIISTTSWLGGKNSFLGFGFISVGIVCALFGAIFIVIHVKYGHSLQEMARNTGGIEPVRRAAGHVGHVHAQ